MHPMLRTSLKVWLLLFLLTALIFALWWGFEGRHEGLRVILDDEGISITSGGVQSWLFDLGGIVFAALFLLVVVPVVLVVALGVPLLAVGGALVIGLLALGLVLAISLSPLLLPLLLVWWLLRRDRRQRMAPPPVSPSIAP
jgi:uncharacterized membrane protein